MRSILREMFGVATEDDDVEEKRDSGRKFPDTNRFKDAAKSGKVTKSAHKAGPKAKRPPSDKAPRGDKPDDDGTERHGRGAPTASGRPHGSNNVGSSPSHPDDGPDDNFPDLPAPRSAVVDLGPSPDDYQSPFGALGMGGGSSWEGLPDWMRDQERMPHHMGGSQPIPGKGIHDPQPGTTPDRGPGLLSRLFQRRRRSPDLPGGTDR